MDQVASVCKSRRKGDEPASRSAIAQWEVPEGGDKQHARPGFDNLIAAARLLNVSLDYLVGFSEVETVVSDADAALVVEKFLKAEPAIKEAVKSVLKIKS